MDAHFFSSVFNFTLLSFILLWKGSAPLKEFVQKRSEQLRDDLHESEKLLKKAQEEYSSSLAYLENFDNEAQTLRLSNSKEIKNILKKMQEMTQSYSEKIINEANDSLKVRQNKMLKKVFHQSCIQLGVLSENILNQDPPEEDMSFLGKECFDFLENRQ